MRKISAVLTAAVLFTAASYPARPEERQLTAAEIDQVLAGNTIDGAWKGKPYRQYFDKSGLTIYLAEADPPSNGKWRAQASSNQYCSQWGPGTWACYDVFSDGAGGIIWRVPSDGYQAPATILEGQHLY